MDNNMTTYFAFDCNEGLLNSGRLSESGRLCILCGLCGKETSLIVQVCNTVQLKFSLGYTEGRNRH